MTCRAGLRGFLRGGTLILRGGTAQRRAVAAPSGVREPKSALFCVPVATARPDLRITRQCGVRVWWVCELLVDLQYSHGICGWMLQGAGSCGVRHIRFTT